MSGDAEDLIRELARDLRPVRPVPRLQTALVGLLVGWAVVAALGILLGGLRPDWHALLRSPFGSGGILVGLTVTGVCGSAAALAMSVPGRERAARVALAGALAGLAWAAGAGTHLFLASPVLDGPWDRLADLHCLGVAVAVGLLPALGLAALAGRAAPFRPLGLALAAAAACTALGAVAAQASCPYEDVRHLMLGHLLAPGVGALLLLRAAPRRPAAGGCPRPRRRLR